MASLLLLRWRKQDGAERHRRQQFQLLVGLDGGCEQLGVPEIAGDRLAIGFAAVILQGQPELQRPKTAGKLDRFVEEGEGLAGILVEDFYIVAAVGEGFARRIALAVKQAAAIDRLVKPFMRIERDRVGKIEPVELFPARQEPPAHRRRRRHAARGLRP